MAIKAPPPPGHPSRGAHQGRAAAVFAREVSPAGGQGAPLRARVGPSEGGHPGELMLFQTFQTPANPWETRFGNLSFE